MFDFQAAEQLFVQDDLIQYVVPVFVLALMAEAIWSRVRTQGVYHWPDTGASLLMLAASAVFEVVPKIVAIALMIVCYEISPLRGVVGHGPWAWVLLFFLDDFTYYWFHRLNHSVRFFWAGHINHHSSEYLNYGTALRQGVGERFYKLLFWLWLPLLGFDPGMVLLMIGINLSYQFWVHTEAVRRLPAGFEAIFNTPSHHRVHHGSNVRYLDRNHAGVLIIWDKLFGTFSPEAEEEPVVYGLTENIDTHHPWRVLVHGYTDLWRDLRRAGTWGDRWRYLARAPGWSHDGPDKRSETLRAQAEPKPA